VRKIFPACVLWLLAAGSLAGQSLAERQLPAPPSAGLSDESGVLGKGSDAQRRVAAMIDTLERERGYRIFLVIERSLISSNPNDMAAQLQQAWLPDGGGLVVVYESDTRILGFGLNLDPGEGMTAGRIGVPSYELHGIIGKALEETVEKVSAEKSEVYLETLVTGLCEGIEAYFARKEAPADGGRSLRLALVTVGALSLLALCGMGLGWLMGRAERRQMEVRVFPEVDVPERLGAPYGGGCGGSGSFGEGRKEIG
jgi:hypothetical protein